LFELVDMLGSEVRSAISTTTTNGSSVRGEARAPSPKGRGKAPREQHIAEGEVKESEDFDGIDNNDPLRYDDVEGYVKHAYCRDIIAKGFCNKTPSRLPGYFPIDDPC
jgi:hypothetical protein